jgi:hypothetical protein
MPTTFRKVSCWPAKEASGRSSAVADERTAKDAAGLPALSVANASPMAFCRSSGNGWASTMPRISAPAMANARTSSVSSEARRLLMRSARPSWARNCRNACAVVAKPVGTRTPWGSWEIISPRLAFLPPTDSTSVILRFSNGTTRAVASKSADMGKLQKLKTVIHAGRTARSLWLLGVRERQTWRNRGRQDCLHPVGHGTSFGKTDQAGPNPDNAFDCRRDTLEGAGRQGC